MTNHDPKCLAYGYGPGQRMDICICTGIRIGRADERERVLTDLLAKAEVLLLSTPTDGLPVAREFVELIGGAR